MACPSITTGQRYLEGTLAHIDCQAQSIGGFGFAALADPASPIAIALTSVLVIFVALFGLRIALGYPLAGRDVVGHVIRLVIVLTLATSWPAWRAVGYDMVISGPAEISQLVGQSAELPGTRGDLASRLQRIDDGFAYLNEKGTGRRGVQNGDWFQLGFARSAFLTGTLGPLALVRLTGGILLALAPLVAGLLLFGVTRSIFAGWAKALVAVFIASIALALMLAVELALLEPWMRGVVAMRGANQQTLGAPTEGLTITLAFALMNFGAVLFAGWIAFNSSFSATAFAQAAPGAREPTRTMREAQTTRLLISEGGGRARQVADAVATSIRRDERLAIAGATGASGASADYRPQPMERERSAQSVGQEALGSSYRRTSLRSSRPGQTRDQAG